MSIIRYLIVLISVTMLTACSYVDTKPQHIVPLYKSLAHYDDMLQTARDSMLVNKRSELKALLKVFGYDSLDSKALLYLSSSPAVEAFVPVVDSIYPSLQSIEIDLGKILANADKANLQLPHRTYIAVVWGKPKSMMFVDSCMMIALNHYLGENFQGYANWPAYIRATKTPQQLPYDMAEALIATQYPCEISQDATALSRMIYEGAMALTKQRIVENSTPAAVLGYNEEQWKWLEDNEKNIWLKLINDKLLYSTSQNVIGNLILPSPTTNIISPYSPGRVGRYVGYRIVSEYLAHNVDTPLQVLLSPSFYNDESILIKSKYSGEK